MNVKLFEEIKAAIRQEPKRINMGDWIELESDNAPTCGTVCCIAGHALVLSEMSEIEPAERSTADIRRAAEEVHNRIYHGYGPSITAEAATALDLEEERACRLFYAGDWPQRFQERLYAYNAYATISERLIEPQTAEYAEVVCEVIDDFIATDGWRWVDGEELDVASDEDE